MSEETKPSGVHRRRLFGPNDDSRLEQILKENKFTGWKNVAKMMPGFTPKQLRDRWHNYISPRNSFAPWTLEEDKIIVQKVNEFGTKWSQISTYLRGRSDNTIKNRWNTVLKEDFAKNPKKYTLIDENEYNEEKQITLQNSPQNQHSRKDVKQNSSCFLDERFIDKFFEQPIK